MKIRIYDNPSRSLYLLRKFLGFLGILLPVFCLIGGLNDPHGWIQDSISAYYHTNMRDVFVGIMIAVSVFLLTYKGYDSLDNTITFISGGAGVLVAFFPTSDDFNPEKLVGLFQMNQETSLVFHMVGAITFFTVFAVQCLWLFQKSDTYPITDAGKLRRNRLYKVCGFIILASLVILLALFVLRKYKLIGDFNRFSIVFCLEAIMLVSFGIAWLVKGEWQFRNLWSWSRPAGETVRL